VLAKYHTHHNHPTGEALRRQLALYAEELKLVGVFKPTLNTAKYAERIYADVLS
jgi:NitT/TauT family transport system substrate-binding protein